MCPGRLRRVLVVTTALGLAWAAPTVASNRNHVPGGVAVPTFSTSVDLITLSVAVRDRGRDYIAGLEPRDFSIYEEGVEQEVAFFSREGAPLDLTLLIDISSSMKANLAVVHAAATSLVRALRTQDRASIVGFNQRLQVLQPSTSDGDLLESSIRRVEADGSTALNTAIYVALMDLGLGTPRSASPRRHALVVFSDGVDTASLVDFDRVADAARRAGIAIYVVQLAQHTTDPAALASLRFDLETLSRDTGGQAHFPADARRVPAICRDIAKDLAHQYTLGYVSSLPAATKPGGGEIFRRVTVVVRGRPGARLHTRRGYVLADAASDRQARRAPAR